MKLFVAPQTISAAKEAMARGPLRHRHCEPPRSGLFAVAVRCAETCELHGVAIVGRPVARGLQNGLTCEILRVATDGARNACSMLYGACVRASRALGYTRVVTYTLAREPGISLRAAGFKRCAEVAPRTSWSCASRPRRQRDLFGNDRRPAGAKVRWEWDAGRVWPESIIQ